MELTVKFVDYGNGISVSKVDPRCGRSVASAVWSQRDQQWKSFSLILLILYTLSGRIGKVVASHVAVARSILLRCTDLYYARGAQGVLPMRVGGATSQLDLPSLTPLSVAGCG